MFWVISKNRVTLNFDTIDELFCYINSHDDIVEGFIGYKL
jgi:hypothetical protein